MLAINAGVVLFLMRSQGTDSQTQRNEVTISSEQLDKLGVNRNPVGNLGTELVVGPDARFNGKVAVSSDVDIAGQLRLSGDSKLSAASASLANLQAGSTSLSQLNVNGDINATSLGLRKDLSVVGATRLQGAVTVNNSMNVVGNLTVGGSLFAGSFQANNLVSGSTLTIGGHIINRSAAPSVSRGGAIGSNGTVSISGGDTAGTVAVNVGSGGGNGTIVNVNFHEHYSNIPHVVITAVGRSAGNVYVTRSTNGFSISVSGSLTPGGYAFDYIVVQ
jgi:hypothetical protein